MPLMIGCPKAGVVRLDVGAAKLTIASKAPTEQRVKAMKARGLKRPDCEEGFFFMRFSFVSLQRRRSLTIRKLRPERMLFFRSLKVSCRNLRPNNVSSAPFNSRPSQPCLPPVERNAIALASRLLLAARFPQFDRALKTITLPLRNLMKRSPLRAFLLIALGWLAL